MIVLCCARVAARRCVINRVFYPDLPFSLDTQRVYSVPWEMSQTLAVCLSTPLPAERALFSLSAKLEAPGDSPRLVSPDPTLVRTGKPREARRDNVHVSRSSPKLRDPSRMCVGCQVMPAPRKADPDRSPVAPEKRVSKTRPRFRDCVCVQLCDPVTECRRQGHERSVVMRSEDDVVTCLPPCTCPSGGRAWGPGANAAWRSV